MNAKKGIHALMEGWVKDGSLLDDILFLKKLFRKVIKECKLKSIYIKFHKFEPQGVTGFALLTASHMAIHSWSVCYKGIG